LLKIIDLDLEDLVFIDETGINIHMARNYGYSPVGQRVFDSKPGEFTRNYTVLGALNHCGVGALMVVEGGTSVDVWRAFVEQVLLPTLRPGQILILDNLAAHKNETVKEMLAQSSIEVVHTPPYSPEWNAIELVWSKIKTYLRSRAERSLEALQQALVDAADLVTPQEAVNCIRACGYV